MPCSETIVATAGEQAGAAWPENRALDLYERTSDVRGGRDWWSFQPIKPIAPPAVKHTETDGNPIDAFILAKLAIAALLIALGAALITYEAARQTPGAENTQNA